VLSILPLFSLGVFAYQNNVELLTNNGFENADISAWKASSCTLTRDTNNVNSGSYSMMVTNRQYYYSSPQQDITELLQSCGQGGYSFSAYMKLLAGQTSTKMYIVISIECTGQAKSWVTGNQATITSSAFTKSFLDDKIITWQGTLTRAAIYVQNVDSSIKTSLYVDDYSLIKTNTPAPTLPPSFITTDQTLQKRNAGAPAVGAIRWDAWLPKPDSVGSQVARSLGPNKYHFRLPYFALAYGDNNVDFPTYTQAQMDAEINYAAYAGIDYWAYCWYPIGNSMTTARNLHVSSSIRDKVKMCAIIGDGVASFGSAERAQLVSYFKESFYMKVQGRRPLLYFFSNTNAISTILAIQQDCTAQGIPMPYCVSMEGASLGFDAVSHYGMSGLNGEDFATLAQSAENDWTSKKNYGINEIPFVSTGWDPRPRYDNPVSWTTVTADSWVQTATPSEIAAHLQDAINFANNNPSSTLANAIIMYAWNEHDEGGWLCPTTQVDASGNVLQSGGVNLINTDRIDAYIIY